ncbi:MAG TPA: hypothetical protein VFK16_02380, partial [Gemmatimonadaceae bacterium]|nr:hypothetical protein [Gemmatimonadaceae bacterium]
MNTRLLLLALALPATLLAQQGRSADTSASRMAAQEVAGQPRPVHVVTQHSAMIGGAKVDYDATVGSIILRNGNDEPTAEIFYTAYTRRGMADASRRPLMFAYNGGPGSSSFWVHMGLLGPKRVEVPDGKHASPPPYTLVDNEYSLLDKTDLVFIDPVGTGFSKPIGKGKGADFWGVDQDARSLAQFVSRYLSENDRWNSPRYLMGESYGTTRSAALSALLQRQSTDLNGVVLLSAVLDFQTISFNPGNDEPFVMYLPSYAAVAWYHDALPSKPAQLRPFLTEVEHFATHEYATALLQGDQLTATERGQVLDKLHQYTGLSRDYLDRANLRVTASQFEQELLREQGKVVGRLDARYTGMALDPLGEDAEYDPQSAAISSAYKSVWLNYLHNDLNYGRDKTYATSGNVNPWDWTHGQSQGWPGYTNVATDLAMELQMNPNAHVMLNSGLYDLATPYFAAEWTMDHLGVPKSARDRITLAEYESGHMVYVHMPALA